MYETTMIGRHGKDLIKMIPDARTSDVAEIVPGGTPTGRDAAVAVVALMQRTVKRLPPMTIVNLFNSHMGSGQVEALWSKLKDATAACMQDGAEDPGPGLGSGLARRRGRRSRAGRQVRSG
ncbi:hypothetical protein ACQPTN_33855 [Bradyrhizobium sp. 13971]